MSRVVSSPTRPRACPPRWPQARGIRVVPLQVVIGAEVLDEGSDGATPDVVAARAARVRPGQHLAPGAGGVRRRLPRARGRRGRRDRLDPPVGRDERHLRVGAARGARGRGAGARVDSRAGRASRPGTPPSPPPTCSTPAGRRGRGRGGARAAARPSSSLFYVDTLEYLRRGGRIGAAAAIFGGALSVKPLLEIADGQGRPAGAGAHGVACAGPARGARGRGGRRPARSTSASPTSPTPERAEELAARPHRAARPRAWRAAR